uniref:Uncharacterized protein n=1 Tax=Anguilla anguilla TaxID=7936 RepID=A0A0E9UDM5_ANGAN
MKESFLFRFPSILYNNEDPALKTKTTEFKSCEPDNMNPRYCASSCR